MILDVGGNDEEFEQTRTVRFLLAFNGSTPAYKAVLDVHGWGDLQPELNALSKRGEWTEVGDDTFAEIISELGRASL